jgi:uncharacterized damage-inducible protein DinB
VISLQVLRELYDYNYWANGRHLDACAALSGEQFLRPMGSSFPSVRDTLTHMMGSEWIWLARWRGRAARTMPGVPEGLPFAETLRRWHEQFSTVEAIRERWREIETDLRDYLAGLDERTLVTNLTYVNLQGKTWTYPLWRTLLHLANHSTFHRGQITTLLRQLGAAVRETDYLVMQDEGLLR